MHAEIAATLERGKPVTGHWSLAGVARPPPPGVHRRRRRLLPRDDLARGRAREAPRRDVGAVPRGLDVPRRRRARGRAHRGRRRSAPLPARHRRRPAGHDRRRRAHGPGRPPRDRGGHRPAGRDPDGDAERRGVLRHAPRSRLDRARPARRHPVRRGPRATSGRTACSPTAARWGSCPAYEYPPEAYRVDPAARGRSTEADLRIEASGDVAPRARDRRRLGKRDDRAPGRSSCPSTTARCAPSAELDVAKLASIERHGGPGTIGLGFVKGLGLQRGAVASTIAHDNHNLLVAGMSDADMIFAVERLVEVGGGMVAVADGEVLGLVELPIAGLMSDRPVAEVAEQTLALEDAYRRLGSSIENPAMIFSFLSLGGDPGAAADQSRAGRRRRRSSSSRRSSESVRLLRAALLLRARASGPSACAPSLGAGRG